MWSVSWILITVFDIIAIVSLLKSGADTAKKILWLILILVLPLIGMILYFLMGPGRRKVI
jgi:hypothetical protein